MSVHGQVVVGVDGSEVALEAVKFAAREAELRNSRLLIVHAGERHASVEAARAELERVNTEVRATAVAAAVAAAPDVEHDFVHSAGDAARVLTFLSGESELVVVGTHRMGRLRGFVLGSVSQQVAAHAQCPVATVSGPAPVDGPLVVGASGSDGGLAAVRFACAEARRRGVPVKAIRAVTVEDWTAVGYGYPVAVSADVLEASAKVQLSRVLKLASEEFPDVVVAGELTTSDAFAALEQATLTASLVVVGSRRDEHAVLPHLGPVTAWLLHQAQCPLVVVPFLVEEAPDGGASAKDSKAAATAAR